MGSFSWMKADTLTNTANILEGAAFKFLIPKEYGGGFIKDHYQDYGYLGHDNEQHEYDMYELLAFWNQNAIYKSGRVKDYLQFNGDFPKMKKIDQYTDDNRTIGINIGCYDCDINLLRYPLKLVSCTYKGTYEDCIGRSYGDPEQGWVAIKRNSWDYENMVKKINQEMEKQKEALLKDIFFATPIELN